MNPRLTSALGAINLALAVGTGAFGAHGLKNLVAPALLATWHTAVLYHLLHGLGLLMLGLAGLCLSRPLPGLGRVANLLLLGIVLFSGSLYLLVLTGPSPLGIVTPFGGVAFIAGWLLLAWQLWRHGAPAANT